MVLFRAGSRKLFLIGRFTCPEKAILFNSSFRTVLFFFLLTQTEKKDFQPVKSFYFGVGQQKKEPLEKK